MNHSHFNIYLTIILCVMFNSCLTKPVPSKWEVESLSSQVSSLRSSKTQLESEVSWLQYRVGKLEEKCTSP
jgi:outer membrane murein-binding lipoprotein Lpp